MNPLEELFHSSWPWYVAGPLIGLMVPFIYYFLNKGFGISTTFKDICAMCLPTSNISFFDYDWRANSWNLIFALGIVTGAIMVGQFFPNGDVQLSDSTLTYLQSIGISDLSGLVPAELFSWEAFGSPISLVLICVGGFLVGFGTRYAGGCTSGHAITGLSQMSPASLVAVIGFFIGGLISTWIVLPQIFTWL